MEGPAWEERMIENKRAKKLGIRWVESGVYFSQLNISIKLQLFVCLVFLRLLI